MKPLVRLNKGAEIGSLDRDYYLVIYPADDSPTFRASDRPLTFLDSLSINLGIHVTT
jgi:hypothetical protein